MSDYHISILFPYNVNRLVFAEGEDGMAKYRPCSKGLVFTAFGAGILLALCIPVKVLLFILALMLIILGITCSFK